MNLVRILLLGLTLGFPTIAATNSLDEDTGYSDVMHGLVVSMQEIVLAIMQEDYDSLQNIAEDIAYHPGPSSDKRRELLNKLGMEALTFKMYEDNVRQHALKLMRHAHEKNRIEVLKSFAELAKGCTDCHTAYRARIRGYQNHPQTPSLFGD